METTISTPTTANPFKPGDIVRWAGERKRDVTLEVIEPRGHLTRIKYFGAPCGFNVPNNTLTPAK